MLFLICSSASIHAQISGQNLMEYQYGQLPGDTTGSFSTIYDRVLLDYSYKKFKVGGTLENFYSPYESRNYTRMAQFRIQYNSKPLELKIGNFYETLGRGILLRSYEIPGAILEDKSYRSRHYFHRDLLGASAKFRHKDFTAKLIYGKPLNNVLPPTFDQEDLRSDQIIAFQSDYSLNGHLLGLAVMNLQNESVQSWHAMINASGAILPYLSYYTEFAKNVSDFAISDFSSEAAFAFYGNLSLSLDRFGLSAEYKNYSNYLLGSGFNEPPALVREHSYKVLNRSTHVLQPQNERGVQLEGFFFFPDESSLVVNHTRAVNDFGKTFIFQEYFAEYSFALNEKHDLKLFGDFAQDPFKLEENQFQHFYRNPDNVQNQVLSIGFSSKSKISGYIVSELSNDPVIVDQGTKIWLGTGAKYKINNRHTFQIFAGERRGGPACNSGVCYEVLDFKGVELRLSSRF